ncbi:MAG TPA: TPM domain-containing protein [Nitrospira sp.]|nr:TPM domain-containing protein [Nitrospira sp.]
METGKFPPLGEQEKARISEAVRAAESHTNAEIVPMLVARSGLYRDAQHRTGLALALMVLTASLMGEGVWVSWAWQTVHAVWLLLATLVAYVVGSWIGAFAPVIRAVTSTERLRHKVRLRAERAFAQHRLSRTRQRTAVLLMVSLLERHVYVLPDSGIGSGITATQWNEVVEAIVTRLKEHDVTGGFCAGIERCGALLARACPADPGDNPDELSNRLLQEP